MTENKNRDQRALLTWLGAGLVMLVLLFMWLRSMPERLKIAGAAGDVQNVITKPLDDLRGAWRTSNERIENLKMLGEALSMSFQAQAVSTATLKLTPAQIEKLKDKIK